MFKNSPKHWQNLSVRLSQSSYFKMLYKGNNEQFLSESTLYLTYYQKKIGKNAMLRHFIRITDKCLKSDFPKVVVLRVLRKEQ